MIPVHKGLRQQPAHARVHKTAKHIRQIVYF